LVLLGLLSLDLVTPKGPEIRITSATIGEPVRIEPEGNGDVWTTTWADDGDLYSVADDTHGFGHECNSNLAVFRLQGDDPTTVRGEVVNCMREYGAATELGEDGACWKANGLICVDSVLYLTVSRHTYHAKPFWVQHAWDASIVKSDDYGRTWTPAPAYGAAMFPGRAFGAPFFVQYGRDGGGDGDGADAYVYAVSPDGVWDNGSSMILGRVLRGRIGSLDPGDWEFSHGFDEAGLPIWTPRHEIALPIFRAPGRTSMTGVHYLAGLGLYVMPQWHYPHLSRPDPERWLVSQWELYQAPAPWGPWELFHIEEFAPTAFYNPSIPAKFISPDGSRLTIFCAGDFATQAHYALHALPVTLEVAP
jgi:hypothetical protein